MKTKQGSAGTLGIAATILLFAGAGPFAFGNEGGPQSSTSSTSARSPAKFYQEPDGFGGHKWGDPFLSFRGLQVDPIAIDASYTDGGDVPSYFRCVQVGSDPCDISSTIARLPAIKPHAYILVTQHRIEGQGFRMAGVTMYPVTHFFCARWREFLKEAPPDVADRMRYCGIRLEFESESSAQLAALPADHVTQYQRLLRHMVLTYGRPYGYKGQVRVESINDDTREARREFPYRYRWCTDLDSIFQPKCDVKISLTFDVESGKGSILISAPLLHQFAAAQEGNAPGKRGALYHEIFTSRPPK